MKCSLKLNLHIPVSVTPESDSRDASGAAHAAAAPPTATSGIAIVGVRKSFGVTKALNGCSFNALLGEIHAIVGGNGCGKSTLAKVISGVVPVDSGQVSVLGLSPSGPHEARAAGIATVFQEVLVADDCSVLENLYLGADSLWSRSQPMSEKYETAKVLMRELTGLPIDPDTLVGLLPLGIKQWITIGRALLCKPRVLILDESSAALDLDSTERLFAKMRELRDGGAAVIIVTHRIAELIRICDRATVLRDGRDVGVLQKSEITEKNLLRLMTGKTESVTEGSNVANATRHGDVVLHARSLKVWAGSAPVDCQLHQGEILGVAGLDGQGQSEFVRILAGVHPALESAPQVRDATGQFTDILDLQDAVAQGVSYVSGDRKREGIFANLSIFENLLMPLYRRKSRGGRLAVIDWGGLDAIFDWEVERLAIRMGERTNKITSLSGGNQQKVLIGRAFALNPKILVLNDPARGIDVGAKAELYRHLRDFAALGKSVVYMSSEIEEFVGFCSRVIVFRNGSIFDQFTGKEIHPKLILEAMFGQTRPGHHLPSDLPAEDTENEAVKIIQFDDEKGEGGHSAKLKSSSYPNFNSKGNADSATDSAPDPTAAGAGRATPVVGRIKIVEFDQGDGSPPAAPRIEQGSTTRYTPPEASTAVRPIKIVEFGHATAAPRKAEAVAPRMKIVDFDATSPNVGK